MNRIFARLGIALLVLVVLLMAAVIGARAWFNHYLHSDAFRKSLGEAAAKSLHADTADFAPLDFDGASVYADGFKATRADGGGFSSLDANQLRAAFDWHGLLNHTVQIDEMNVQRLTIAPPIPGTTGNSPTEESPESGTPAPLTEPANGWTVDLRKASISEANWQWSESPAEGIKSTAVTLTPDGPGAWIITAQGGTVQMPGWPDLTLDTASMRWEAPTLFINSADLRNGSSHLNVTGSVETRKEVQLQVKFDGVDVAPYLGRDWREKFTGHLNGTANIDAPLGSGQAASEMSITGTVGMTDAVLTALPILDEIGTFTHTEQFRRLELTRVSAAFTRTNQRLEMHNMIVESEGLIRVDGSYTIVRGQIDGNFQVGLTPGTLQWIPGSQGAVFTDSHDGYLWAPMRLTGPVDHPTDDLTPRLVAAVGTSVIKDAQGIEGTVKKTGEGLLDLLTH
jgi:hypothetical protein